MIGRIRTRLDELRRREAGVSLMELIVYMAIAALVLTLAGTFYVSVARTTTQSVDRRNSTAEAQNMIDVLATDIRAGTNVPVTSTSTTWSVLSASPTSLTLITYTDAGPTFGAPYQVSFQVDASGRLVLSQWNPPASGPSTFPRTDTPSVTRYLGSGVTNPAIFSYLDSTSTPISAAGGMDPAKYSKVAAVTVSLTVQAPQSSVPVNLVNTIWMPNAGLSTAYAGAN